jgi:hypothetical protein
MRAGPQGRTEKAMNCRGAALGAESVQRVQRVVQGCRRGTALTGLKKQAYGHDRFAATMLGNRYGHFTPQGLNRRRAFTRPAPARLYPKHRLAQSRTFTLGFPGRRLGADLPRSSGSLLQRRCSPDPGPVGLCVRVLRVVLAGRSVPPPAARLTRPLGPGEWSAQRPPLLVPRCWFRAGPSSGPNLKGPRPVQCNLTRDHGSTHSRPHASNPPLLGH